LEVRGEEKSCTAENLLKKSAPVEMLVNELVRGIHLPFPYTVNHSLPA